MKYSCSVPFLAGIVAPALFGAGVAHADVVVVPNFLASQAGPDQNGFPYDLGEVFFSSQRYQQAFAASQFSAFGGQPRLITQIAYRPGLRGHAFSSTLPNIQIDLSTTSRPADSLSMVFAQNVGPDDTVVYSGALPLSSNFTGPPLGPKDFDIVIDLQTPLPV